MKKHTTILFLVLQLLISCSTKQNGNNKTVVNNNIPMKQENFVDDKKVLSNMNYNSKNWPEWIYERFGDSNRYAIEIDSDDKRIYTVRSVDKSVKSEICFLIMDLEDTDILYDIQFSGHDRLKNHTWCSPFTVDPEYEVNSSDQTKSEGLVLTSLFYTKDFIDRLENEWLYIPLKNGWTEEIDYVGKKIYRAKLRIGKSNNENWDIIEKVSYQLNLINYLKILFRISLSTEQFKFEPIENK